MRGRGMGGTTSSCVLLFLAACIVPAKALKVLMFGGNGNLGARVLYQLAACGHDVTCFVRSEQRLRAGFNDKVFDDVAVIEADANDRAAVDSVMAAATYDVVVSTAGYVDNDVKTAEQALATPFCRIFDNICSAAEEHLPPPRRALFIGGITALDLPGTSPPQALQPLLQNRFPQYVAHTLNYERLERSTLDWTLFCPGFMVEAAPTGCDPVGCMPPDEPLRLSTEVVPCFAPQKRFRPWQLTRPFKYLFALLPFLWRQGQWTVPLESVAAVIVNHLPAGSFSRARVGLSNPPGVKLKKTQAARKKERSARARRGRGASAT